MLLKLDDAYWSCFYDEFFMRMPSSCIEKKIISTLTLLEDEMVMEVCLVLKAFFLKRSSL